MRLEAPVRLRQGATPTSSSATSRSSATPACGTRRRRWSRPRCAAWSTRRCNVTCADRDLHSGLFGGAAQNPIRVLARILARAARRERPRHHPGLLRRREGAADGHQGGPARAQAHAEGIPRPVGLKVPAGEKNRMLIEQIATRPTAEINGIIGGYTGEGAKTVIPGEATAKVSFRLVGDQDPEKIRDAFRAFVRARLPADCQGRVRELRRRAGDRSCRSTTRRSAKARAALPAEWGKKAVTVGRGRLDPDRRRLQARARHGHASWSASRSTTTACIRRTRSTTSRRFHKGTRSWARILAALAG